MDSIKKRNILKGKFSEIIVFMFFVIFITRIISIKTVIFYPLVVVLFSLPIIAFNFYKISMTKKMSLSKFHTEGKIYQFIAGRKFIYAFLIISAPIISGYAVIKMYGFSFKEWLLLFIIIPIFIFVFNLLYKHFAKEIKNVYVNFFTVHWTILVTYVFIAVLFPVVVYFFGNFDSSSFNNLNEAVKIQTAKYAMLKDCSIASVIASKIGFFEGAISFALENLSGWWLFIVVLITAGEGFVFLSLLSSFSLFLLTKDELSMIYKPISASPKKSKPKSIAFIVVLVLISMVYLSSYIFIENKLKTDKNLIKLVDAPQKHIVDIIDGKYVNAGTIKKLQKIKKEFELKMINKINYKIDNAYNDVIGNVDNYLNWYYGLTAEYIRIMKLVTGQLDVYIKDKYKTFLKIDSVFKPVLSEINEIAKSSRKEFQILVNTLIKKNILDVKIFDIVIINNKTSFKRLLMLKKITLIGGKGLNKRITLSVLGGISGAIIGNIMAKKIVQQSLKIIARILAKKSLGFLARVGAGALAGGTGGSAVPVIGTAVGVIVGGIIGFCASNYVVLKLDEAIGREKHKKEIIDAINESRNEFKKWQ